MNIYNTIYKLASEFENEALDKKVNTPSEVITEAIEKFNSNLPEGESPFTRKYVIGMILQFREGEDYEDPQTVEEVMDMMQAMVDGPL